jgi:paraquat-inducible protein B
MESIKNQSDPNVNITEEQSKEIEEIDCFVESFLEDLITAPFKSEIVDLKEELYSVEYKLKNTRIALESSDELLRNANKMIDRLKTKFITKHGLLEVNCSKR